MEVSENHFIIRSIYTHELVQIIVPFREQRLVKSNFIIGFVFNPKE